MNIAIIGYGKMGKEIENIALQRNHVIKLIIDKNDLVSDYKKQLAECDVAIEFTQPDAVINNYKTCFNVGIPVVSGTTGWLKQWDEIIEYCNKKESAFFYASNFSIGVNILFEINKKLAAIMNNYPQYSVDIHEIHHTQKLDAPSGTAISIAEQIIDNLNRYKGWKLNDSNNNEELNITADRINNVHGVHTIKYESDVDDIEITHKAKSRKGFAYGAVLAAEFIQNKKGVFSMNDLL